MQGAGHTLGTIVLLFAGAAQAGAQADAGLATIATHDNRKPAGQLENGILTLRLEAREGIWRAGGDTGPAIRIGAFAEAEGEPSIPGPLVRVPAGTEVRATVRNRLDRPLAMFGLGDVRGLAGDSVLIAPGAEAEFRFVANEPGTYYYLGRTAQPGVPAAFVTGSLHGALVVDPPGARVRAGDRIMVISSWFRFDTTTFSHLSDDATLAINGRTWPHTEIVEATVGDTLEWRWINLTVLEHPMHLHGFHFRLDGRGDGVRDTLYPPEQRRLAVTERVGPGQTLVTTWSPNRPGNWIFHCHMLSHITPIEILNSPPAARGAAHGGDAQHQMGMLVVGIRVAPTAAPPADGREPRRMRLLIRSGPADETGYRRYAYVLGGSGDEHDPGALRVPGPTLVLEREEPVAITVINESHEPAAVHWHGIELESWPDGVPGWSGFADSVMPAIPPGDSLLVRFTPPRAGTFMYHSHFNEMQQIGAGLYGAIVVLPPGERWDPATDRVLLLSDAAPWTTFTNETVPPPTLLNGSRSPALALRAGEKYRLRVINILTESSAGLTILDGGEPARWRSIAKDGADLPAHQAKREAARVVLYPGEIRDYEFTPAAAGQLVVEFGKAAPWNRWERVAVRVGP